LNGTGLTLAPNGVISGTPLSGMDGTYDLLIQVTDAGQRSVIKAFVLIIQPSP